MKKRTEVEIHGKYYWLLNPHARVKIPADAYLWDEDLDGIWHLPLCGICEHESSPFKVDGGAFKYCVLASSEHEHKA